MKHNFNLFYADEHLSSTPVFSGVRVSQYLVLYVCFVDRCLSFCTFSFGHCVVCSSSIYGFWFPLWYLQTLLRTLLLEFAELHECCREGTCRLGDSMFNTCVFLLEFCCFGYGMFSLCWFFFIVVLCCVGDNMLNQCCFLYANWPICASFIPSMVMSYSLSPPWYRSV